MITSDFPDPDVIRVDDTYYMISTTMHFMPGGVILISKDLAHWKIASYVFPTLSDTPGQRLSDDTGIYGKGMWAASLRFHKGTFYVCFVANDTGKTYLFTSDSIYGPWKKNYLEGFYHDCSLLFDEDDRVYIAYGNREIFISELNETLTARKEGGLHRLAVKDTGNVWLGYEGTHFYKRNGRYYLFFIHWPKEGIRTESCFSAVSLTGEFIGGDVLCSDLDGRDSGVAQGGIVDTPNGDVYAILFQDHGAIGRIPVLVPVSFQNDFPVFGKNGQAEKRMEIMLPEKECEGEELWCSDDFCYEPDKDSGISLKKPWQWNHNPDNSLWSVTERHGALRLRSGKLSVNVTQAVNTLTQRAFSEHCAAEVTVDGNGLNDGDYAGILALEGEYRFLALTKENGTYALALVEKDTHLPPGVMGSADRSEGIVLEKFPIADSSVTLKLLFDFSKGKDTAEFFYRKDHSFLPVGDEKKLFFRLDHFTGCRFALFLFSTKTTGGHADFTNFIYRVGMEQEEEK